MALRIYSMSPRLPALLRSICRTTKWLSINPPFRSVLRIKLTPPLKATLAERGADIAYDVVSNPEFLKEGAAVADRMRPERIVIGCDNDRVIDIIRELYEPFNRNHDRMIVMDIRSAEFDQIRANCMLATKSAL